jgi:hypothetical protein
MSSSSSPTKPIPNIDVDIDIEKSSGGDYAPLTNSTVQSYAWENISVTVKDRETKQPKTIVSKINGIVKAGKYLLATKT